MTLSHHAVGDPGHTDDHNAIVDELAAKDVALADHAADTTAVHGIVDTAQLATLADLAAAGGGTMSSQNADAVAITGGTIVGITDLAVADGGTGAGTASAARTNLGLGSIAVQDASTVTITGGSVLGITDLAVADGGTGASTAANARTNLGLGTIATQASSAVSITGGTVTGITDLALVDGGTGASDATTARSNLGLGTIATQASSAVSITGGSVTGITDLTVADGGTGASTASAARTNLGVVIGTDVAPPITVSAVKTTTYTIAANELARANTSGGAFAFTLPSAPANGTVCGAILVTAGNTLTVNRGGTDVFDVSGGPTSMSLYAAGDVLLAEYSGGVWLVTVRPASSLTDGTYTYVDSGTPGVVKVQLDDEVGVSSLVLTDSGRKLKTADYMTTTPIPSCTYNNGTLGVGATLTATANGAFANVDGQTATLNDKILVTAQAAPLQNGLYDLTQVGTGGTPFILTRDVYTDQAADWANGIDVHVAKGALHGGRIVKFRALSYVMGTSGFIPRPAVTMGDIFTGVDRGRTPVFDDFDGFATTKATVATLPVHIDGVKGFWYGTGGAAEQVSQIDSTVSGGETVSGCANMETGTTTTGRVFYTTQLANALDFTNRFEWYARLKVPIVSDGTQTFNVKAGFFTSPDGAPTDGLYWEAISGTANWQCVTRVAGASTNTDSGIAYNTGFRNLVIVIPGDGSAYFYNGPTLVATISSGLPTGAICYPGVGILKSAGTTSRQLRLDVFGADFPTSRPSLFVP